MSSPERDKELLKERMEQQARVDEPRQQVGSFLRRFSDNEEHKRHKVAVVEQQRIALLG